MGSVLAGNRRDHRLGGFNGNGDRVVLCTGSECVADGACREHGDRLRELLDQRRDSGLSELYGRQRLLARVRAIHMRQLGAGFGDNGIAVYRDGRDQNDRNCYP